MFIHEAIYDLDVLAKENLHIHTNFSRCGRQDMILPDIVRIAENSGLKIIAITNHIHPHEEHLICNNEILRKQLNDIETDVKVLLGFELSAYGIGKYTQTDDENSSFDYRLYSYNHYHQDYWDFPEDKTAIGFFNHGREVLTQLFKDKRADCIAHPFNASTIREYITDGTNEDDNYVTRVIDNNAIGDLLELAFEHEVAFELNTIEVPRDPDFYHRLFNIGREVGAVFNLGTDAHNRERIDTKNDVEVLKKILY